MLIPPEHDPERICVLCDELISEAQWDDRHSIGVAAAHDYCCVRNGCEDVA